MHFATEDQTPAQMHALRQHAHLCAAPACCDKCVAIRRCQLSPISPVYFHCHTTADFQKHTVFLSLCTDQTGQKDTMTIEAFASIFHGSVTAITAVAIAGIGVDCR